MTIWLESITVRLPGTNADFTNSLASLLNGVVSEENNVLRLTSSGENLYPGLIVDFQPEGSDVLTGFALSDGGIISVKIENSTGLHRQSPYSYQVLSVETVIQRLVTSGIRLIGIDHVGLNLPWFSSGLHPSILRLRQELSPRCLYHRFPSGEPWDFILPGDIDEIARRKKVDYSIKRRPKFELVSFTTASTPLIQFDVGVNAGHEKFMQLFPESLNDPEYGNIWVYLQTPYPVDVCLVINEYFRSDWSDFFEGFRL